MSLSFNLDILLIDSFVEGIISIDDIIAQLDLDVDNVLLIRSHILNLNESVDLKYILLYFFKFIIIDSHFDLISNDFLYFFLSEVLVIIKEKIQWLLSRVKNSKVVLIEEILVGDFEERIVIKDIVNKRRWLEW